jgi:hypothetical protein
MIKFFRKIRKTLLNENKFSKYLIYAFGEIILVVIGILIALWINNWNNENQTKEIEIKYLTEIRNNLKRDVKDVRFNIDFNIDKLKSNKLVLSYLNGEIEQEDSLGFHFSNLMGSTRTVVDLSAYESLKSKGFEIIQNDSLRQSITKLYSTTYHNIIDFEIQDDHRHQYDVLWPEIIKSIHVIEMWSDGKPIDEIEIKNNFQLKSAISTNISMRNYMISNYKNINMLVLDLIDHLEEKLVLEKNEG